MTTQESARATIEARRAAGLSSTPVTAQEMAIGHYLTASTYDTRSADEPVIRHSTELTADDPEPSGTDSRSAAATTPVSDPVVVGIDGSASARSATQWAAGEASRRRTGLHLVHAYHLPPAGAAGYNPYPPHLLTDLREEGSDILADTAREVKRNHPEVPVTTTLAYGDPVTVLRHASRAAALTVVGARGASRVGVALGSVAAEIAKSCPVPVAVIHPASSRTDGPVVVGVDDISTSATALEVALNYADTVHAPVIAVHCWTDWAVDGPVPAYSAVLANPDLLKKAESRRLTEAITQIQDKYPDVTVEQVVIHDRPSAALLTYAPSARLIVIGSRGHTGIAGMLLGSTGQALIAHSSCPVIIAR